jgi:hypothetical protein
MARMVFAVIVLLFCATVVAQDVTVIDLTGPRPAAPVESGIQTMHGFTHTWVSHGPNRTPEWPLVLELLRVTPDAADAATLIAEVQISAMQETTIPRSEDEKTVDPDGRHLVPGYKQMMVGLRSSATPGRNEWIATRPLFGSSAAAGSLLSMKAGETVRIRFSVRRNLPASAPAATAPEMLHAVLLPFEGTQARPHVFSRNTVPLVVGQ